MSDAQLKMVVASLAFALALIVVIFLPAIIAYRRRTYYRGWINLLCLAPLAGGAFGPPGWMVAGLMWFVLLYFACVDEKDKAAE